MPVGGRLGHSVTVRHGTLCCRSSSCRHLLADFRLGLGGTVASQDVCAGFVDTFQPTAGRTGSVEHVNQLLQQMLCA